MANDINDILGINLPKEEPASKSKIISDLLQNLVFSLGQGYSAQGTGRGSQARSAGIGAALQGPMVLQQIRDKQQADAQERQINMAKARELIRQGRNNEAMDLLKIRTQLPEETTMTPPPAPTEPVIEGTPETGLTVKSLGTPTYAKPRPEMITLPNGQQVQISPPSAGDVRNQGYAADARTAALEEVKRQIEAKYRAPQNVDPNSQSVLDSRLAYETALSKIPQRPAGTPPPVRYGVEVPFPPAVAAQRKELQPSSTTGEPLVAVMLNGQPTLVPRSQAAGLPPASQREQGRKLPAGDATKISDMDTGLNNLETMKKELPAGATGYQAKAGALLPNVVTQLTGWGTQAKQQQAIIDRVKQIIGKTLEGGVLRKEDEIKYEKILPTIGDPPAVAGSKIDGLIEMIKQKRETAIDAYEDASYDVTKFRARSGAQTPAPPGGGLYVDGVKQYNIPADQVKAFLKDHPNAKPKG